MQAGSVLQGSNTIAIGFNAGYSNQGANSISIGKDAGFSSQASNSIIINATSQQLNSSTGNALFIAPIRNTTQTTVLGYNTTTNEVTYWTQNGSQGHQGFQGAVGSAGSNGAQGNQGFQGTVGSAGSNGAQGNQGFQGAVGSAGSNGFQGFQGAQGRQGEQGNQGFQGTSFNNNTSQIAIGANAGSNGQGVLAIAIGTNAGQYNQGATSVSIGFNSGWTGQKSDCIAIGQLAGTSNQGAQSVAIGLQAGSFNQGSNSVAIGFMAGYSNQPNNSIVINASPQVLYGSTASAFYVSPIRNNSQNTVLGYDTSTSEVTWFVQNPTQGNQGFQGRQGNQGFQGSVGSAGANGFQGSVGSAGSNGFQGSVGSAGSNGFQGSVGSAGANGFQGFQGSTGSNGIQGNVGFQGNQGFQGVSFNNSVTEISIGLNAGINQGRNAISIGNQAGQTGQSSGAVAIGYLVGSSNQGTNAIAIGFRTGYTNQSSNAIAIGDSAGFTNQSPSAISIGVWAGVDNQGTGAIGIGAVAGGYNQKSSAIAIGNSAGLENQSTRSIAIGSAAGNKNQNEQAIAIGYQAGYFRQGSGSIAIGNYAGFTGQPVNSILINASGTGLNGSTANACYISPIRNATQTNIIGYDVVNKELTYFAYTGSSSNTSSNNYVIDNFSVGLGSSLSYQTSSTTYNFIMATNSGQQSTGVIDSNAFTVPLFISSINSLTFYYTFRLSLFGSNINTDDRIVSVGLRLRDTSGNIVIDMPNRINVSPVDAQTNYSATFNVSSNSNLLNYKNQTLSLEFLFRQTGSNVTPSSSVTVFLSSMYFIMNYQANSFNNYAYTGTEIHNNLVINNTISNSFTSSNLNSTDTRLVVSGNTNNTVAVTSSTNKQRQLLFGYNHVGNYSSITSVEQGVAMKPLVITASSVSIGNAYQNYQLELSTDDARKLTTTTWLTGSDERVKENIQDADVDLCYETIKNLKLKRFRWNDKYYPNLEDRNSIGFIAQEVETVFPKAVKKNNQKFLITKGETEEENVYEEIEEFHSLDIDQINKTLFGAVQKLIKKNEELELKVQNLTNEMELIKQRLP